MTVGLCNKSKLAAVPNRAVLINLLFLKKKSEDKAFSMWAGFNLFPALVTSRQQSKRFLDIVQLAVADRTTAPLLFRCYTTVL